MYDFYKVGDDFLKKLCQWYVQGDVNDLSELIIHLPRKDLFPRLKASVDTFSYLFDEDFQLTPFNRSQKVFLLTRSDESDLIRLSKLGFGGSLSLSLDSRVTSKLLEAMKDMGLSYSVKSGPHFKIIRRITKR